jgi:Rrf2 family iron-sulfur cluster assembly transcriptional regulator
MFGRTTETAIAALGCLAEAHDVPALRSVEQIAAACGRRAPFLAKLLSTLSRSGFVDGERGPGGGYRLARAPDEITLLEIYRLFEGEPPADECAWGGDCRGFEQCPLHDGIAEVWETTRRFLEQTTLEAFRSQQVRGAAKEGARRRRKPRQRATARR